jgi:hypothetical protein
MAGKPSPEFGRRHPQPVQAAPPPVKRSGHVALLVMGTVAIGSGAYALMPSENCDPGRPQLTATSPAGQPGGCTSGRSSSSGGHGSGSGSGSRSYFFGSDSSSGHSASGVTSSGSSSSDSGSGHVTRGGFGAFARAFAGHFSGG